MEQEKYIIDRPRLIACREKLGISKMEAARRIKISQPAYLRYESGDRMPSLHVIQSMARVFDTSVEYLTGKTDDPSPNSYLVTKADQPELFCIVETFQKSDEKRRGRLLAYMEKLSEKEFQGNSCIPTS